MAVKRAALSSSPVRRCGTCARQRWRDHQHLFYRGEARYPEQSAYVASKPPFWASRETTRSSPALRIRVHAICPGVVATQMSAVTHADRPDRMEPEDVAPGGRLSPIALAQAAVDELVLRRNGAVPWSS